MFTESGRAVGLTALSFVRHAAAACLLAALAALTACGGGGGGGSSGSGSGGGDAPPAAPEDPGVAGAPYFSFAIGDRWRTQDGTTTITTRVLRQDAAGLVLREDSSAGSTEEYQIVRSDTAFSFVPLPSADAFTAAIGPYDIARFPLRVGASYTAVDKAINGSFDFDGDGRADNLQVRIVVTVVGFERATVPAGSFDNALRQRTVITQTIGLSGSGRTLVVTGTSDDWYARGVGPVRSMVVVDSDGVRETSDEVLQDYRVGNLSNDTVAPTVSSRTPADGSLGNNASVQLVFSEDIERGSLPGHAISLRTGSSQSLPGRSEWQDARTLVFVPEGFGALSDGSYVVTLIGGPEDWAGNRLVGVVQWAFSIDRTGPVLVAQSPAAGATAVATDAVLSFTFDEQLLPTAASSAAVSLSGPSGPVPISVSVEGRVLSIKPAVALSAGQFYGVVLSGVPDRLGNQAAFAISSSFTTTRGEPGRFAFPEPLPALGDRGVSLVRLADLDGDGHLDLLASALNAERTATNTVVVRRNADGSFASQLTTLPNETCQAQDLSLIDLDADGLIDVLGARSFCGAHWVRQSGPSTWRYGGGLGFSAEQLRAVRLVGQVRPGIVGLDNFNGGLVLLQPRGGAGTTGFETPQVLAGSVSPVMRILQVADVNSDGREDILLATGGNGQILLGLQRADASFEMRSISVPDVDHVWLIADFDGDGRADLLLGETNPSRALVVHLQQADGNFAGTGQRYLLPVRASSAQHADIDGDGRKEIILAVGPDASTVDNLSVFVPRSEGSFTLLPLLQYPTLPNWSATLPSMPSFAVGEFSGDGMIDLLHLGNLIRARAPFAVPAANPGGATGATGAIRALRRLDPAFRPQGN